MTTDTGTHRIVRSFDVMGRRTEESYFGPDGKRTLNEMKAHSRTSQYDNQGNEIRTAFLGVAEERVACTGGYHFRKNTYNKWRGLVSQEYFDEKVGRARTPAPLPIAFPIATTREADVLRSHTSTKRASRPFPRSNITCGGSNMTTVATSSVCASSV